MITCTVPAALNTERSVGELERATIVPLASDGSSPVKLMVETFGRVVPEGQRVRKLAAVGPATVTFIDTATAEVGTPQLPRMAKLRVRPAPRAGPPLVDLRPRVSTRRQGAMAKK